MFSVSILEIVRYVLTGVLLSFCALYFWFHLKFSHWSRKGVPGPLPAFPAGNIAGVFLRRKQFFQPFIEGYAKYKHLPFVGMYTLYNPVLLVNDLKLAKSVLVKDFNHFEAHGTTACEKTDPLSVHIFNMHGEKWRRLRQMFSPVFTTGKIKTMVSHLHAAARDFRAHIDAKLDSGVPEDLSLAFSKFSIDVIGRVAFGLECDSFKDPNSAYVRNGYEFFAPSTVYWRIIRTLWFLTPELFRKLNTPRIKPETTEFFLSLVRQTAAMREREGLKRNDFLQILLDLKNNQLQDENGEPIAGDEGMSWTQMAAHSMVFLAAGFESTSTTAAFTIYELAQNENILDMTRKEMFMVLEKHGGRPTYDALAEMTYLSLVIEETLRKHPPMRALFRRCTKNYHIPGTKVVIEKGTWAFVPIQGFHNDPDIFPEPEKFRPERFLSENRTETQMAAYMPFGDGPKMCLGVRFGMMAVKMALVSFLSRYDFRLSARTPVPMKYSTTALSLVADPGVYVDLRPLKGYDLKVEF